MIMVNYFIKTGLIKSVETAHVSFSQRLIRGNTIVLYDTTSNTPLEFTLVVTTFYKFLVE
ncbi:hypothetical protein LCGC14_1353690 [marine sediment metagenome]|uniref:Uncharacterized protein n=1 Tax=marine sediment metagenome TaxID=412755 RepID=A0A0F9KW91_9ZZZZ